MNRSLSTNVRGVTGLVVSGLVVASSGCSPSYPVVANPTEPWEEQLVHERQAAQSAEESSPQASVARQMYGAHDEKDEEPKHNAFVVAMTDIIAFPFRGAGWLAQQIF